MRRGVGVGLSGLLAWGAWGCEGGNDLPSDDDPTEATGGHGESTGGAPSGGQNPGGADGGGTNGVGGAGGEVNIPTGGSGGAPETIPSAGVSTVAEFCEVFPAAMVGYKAECEGGSPDDWLSSSPDCGAAVRSESAGRVSLNVEQADLCLYSLTGGACQGFSCSQVLTGTVPEEGACNSLGTVLGDECESGSSCASTCASVCRAPRLLSEGESCGGFMNNADCPLPLQCDAQAICNMPLGEGESCRGFLDCRPGLDCAELGDDDASLGTCQPRTVQGGEPCETSGACQVGYCRGEEGAMTCFVPKRVGEPCIFGQNECAQQCSLEGVCEVASKEGGPCGQVEDPATGESESLACAGDLFCELESSTCQPRLESGSSCVDVQAQGDPCERSSEGHIECAMGACQTCDWIAD